MNFSKVVLFSRLINPSETEDSEEVVMLKNELSAIGTEHNGKVGFCWFPDEILIGFESNRIYDEFIARLSALFSVMGLDYRELPPDDFNLYSEGGVISLLPA